MNALYSFHERVLRELQAESPAERFNWQESVEFAAAELPSLVMLDVEAEARDWRNPKTPDSLYFSHAEFYGDGIEHIVEELKRKPTSNRALYSLLNQKQISGTGDKSIPSFLIFQCAIKNETLYCTCYFRALEVSQFLKVNLEEIRQTLDEICRRASGVKRVKLTLFAFRAYVQAVRLVRPQLERLKDDELQDILTDQHNDPSPKVAQLIRELQQTHTAVNPKPFISLGRIVGKPTVHPTIKVRRAQLLGAIAVCEGASARLEAERLSGSYGERLDASYEAYMDALRKLIALLD